MSELNITQNQFIEACVAAQKSKRNKRIVDQIAAVDNFTAFKKLMLRRNSELNEESLQTMLKKE
jgi:hypothetical protein